MNRVATTDRAMQAQIDRLVGGDLPEAERRNLLAWLDEDASRWRACAVAFLETQMWESAATSGPAEPQPVAELQPHHLAPSPSSRRPEGSRISILALTAAVAVAFLGGLVLARWLPSAASRPELQFVEQPAQAPPGAPQPAPPKDQTLIATVPVRTNLDARLPFMLQVPVSTNGGETVAAENSSLSEYERMQWEKRGFEVIEEQRYLPARLPDGRPVVVPVNKVQLKFKGMPVS